MDAGGIFFWGLVIAAVWWFFARNSSRTSNRQQDTYTGATSTGATSGIKTDFKRKRQPQNNLTIDKPDNFEKTEEIERVLETLENTDQNVFLTGKAGTGKSTLLRYFRATTKKSPVVVAPTGVAAVNVQGQTIHSFFGWGIDVTPERVRKASYERSRIYRKMRMLIIDEVSMVRADLFECIDKFLRINTGKPDQPFGGVQVVVIGDPYQLPPVVKGEERKYFETRYVSPFFFSANAFENGGFRKFELGKIFRQKDQDLIDALNAIREGDPQKEHIEFINQAVIHSEPENFDEYTHLVTTNKMAKEINDARMQRLQAEPVTYKGIIFGTFKEKDAPTDLELTLKSGARVMLLNNDKERKWVNGDVVTVLETKPDSITVAFDDDSIAEINQHTWETIRFVFDEEEQKIVPKKVGGFTQIPVKAAWAITIHKAQGKTFGKVFMDLGAGAFAEGQTYVALSRCKSLEGLKLASPLMRDDVFVNEKVREFMSFANGESLSTRARPVGKPETTKVNIDEQRNEKELTAVADRKLSKSEFVLQAIKNLRTKNYKGIHVVYSGFNEAFREYFGDDPVECVKKLEEDGVVVTRPVKGGVMLYDARDDRTSVLQKDDAKSATLSKILKS